MALVNLFFARLLPVNDVRYPFVVDCFAFVVRAEFQVGVHAGFQLLNQGLLSLLGPSFASEIGPVTHSQTMNKHVSTQMFAAKRSKQEMKNHESAQLSAVAIWLCC